MVKDSGAEKQKRKEIAYRRINAFSEASSSFYLLKGHPPLITQVEFTPVQNSKIQNLLSANMKAQMENLKLCFMHRIA
jgi:hypothetical protein